MRKLGLISLVVALAGAGCGGDKDNEGSGKGDAGLDSGTGGDDGLGGLPPLKDAGTVDSRPDGGIKPKYDECPKEMIPSTFDAYAGPKPFSRPELEACQDLCKEDAACFNDENCPGIELWDECANDEVFRCSADGESGRCRIGYENFVCCAAASSCSDDDVECVRRTCAEDLEAFQNCTEGDRICLSRITLCFGDDPLPTTGDAGAESDGDAGTAGTGDKSRRFDMGKATRVLEAMAPHLTVARIKR